MIVIDDKISKVTWTKSLTEVQGFKVIFNVAFQDNVSAIKLGEKVKLSSVKRNSHFDVRMFHVIDLISHKKVKIKHCPTGKMLCHYFSEPLVGKLFLMIKRDFMSIDIR